MLHELNFQLVEPYIDCVSNLGNQMENSTSIRLSIHEAFLQIKHFFRLKKWFPNDYISKETQLTKSI